MQIAGNFQNVTRLKLRVAILNNPVFTLTFSHIISIVINKCFPLSKSAYDFQIDKPLWKSRAIEHMNLDWLVASRSFFFLKPAIIQTASFKNLKLCYLVSLFPLFPLEVYVLNQFRSTCTKLLTVSQGMEMEKKQAEKQNLHDFALEVWKLLFIVYNVHASLQYYCNCILNDNFH